MFAASRTFGAMPVGYCALRGLKNNATLTQYFAQALCRDRPCYRKVIGVFFDTP
jgi:hypothetical protein